ncbi:MAG: hypothetical protein IPM25_17645 [Chloracidobacterium sp.]|nr:hypothetical protein [Chloracidobacterium sp.]
MRSGFHCRQTRRAEWRRGTDIGQKFGDPLKTLTENISSGGKSFVAMIGNGGANLNLTTNSGRILISKQPGSVNEKP